jgi:cysteinyl-tRNA synthetase
MGQKYLGETFDIHGGGIENVFPHHEDEIAQAEAATGKPFVRYWLHNNMVTVGGQKMGKSLGNFLTLRDAFQKWPPMVIRLFILQSHYRSPTDFSEEALEAARAGYKRLAGAVGAVGKALANAPAGDADPKVVQLLQDARKRVTEAMDDDFNTPLALSVLFDLARETNRLVSAGGLAKGTVEALRGALAELAGDVLGLRLGEKQESTKDTEALRKLVEQLLKEREQQRKGHDYAQADKIRDWISLSDVSVKDAAAASSATLPSGFEVRTDADEPWGQSQEPAHPDSQDWVTDD